MINTLGIKKSPKNTKVVVAMSGDVGSLCGSFYHSWSAWY